MAHLPYSMHNKSTQSVIDSLHSPQWVINDFKIVFLLSERILTEIRKQSGRADWYEDPLTTDTCIDQLNLCFRSVQKYYRAFGILPQIGDRLYNEDTGMVVKERAIDGAMMTITFTLSL